MSYLNEFPKWVAVSPTRSADIKIRHNYKNELVVDCFVYDTAISAGQAVQTVDEIDLAASKEKREREEYERLQKKFGGA